MLLACREPEALIKLIKHQDLAQPLFPSLKHHPWLYHSWRSLRTLAGGWLALPFNLQTVVDFSFQCGNEVVYKKYDKMSSQFWFRFLLLAVFWVWTLFPGCSVRGSKPVTDRLWQREEGSALLGSCTVGSACCNLSVLSPVFQLRNTNCDTPNLTQISLSVSVTFKGSATVVSLSSSCKVI